MNILYIHGFGSKFDKQNDKVVKLAEFGTVFGIDIDYTIKPTEIYSQIIDYIIENHIDVIAGSSMGGYFATHIGELVGIPAIVFNPAVDPSRSLRLKIGTRADYTGRVYTLTEDVVAAYDGYHILNRAKPTQPKLVLIENGDRVINPDEAAGFYQNVIRFDGGSHRFDNVDATTDYIRDFLDTPIYAD